MKPSAFPVLPPNPLIIFRSRERMDRELLTVGEMVSGRLVQALNPQRAVIQIKGRPLLADLPFPLPEKVEFQFRVEQTEPRIILKLMNEASSESTLPGINLKAYLAEDLPLDGLIQKWATLARISEGSLPPEIRATWAALQAFLKALSQKFEVRPAAEELKRLISFSGLAWENKLKEQVLQSTPTGQDLADLPDLKGLLIKLKAQLEGAQSDLAEAVAPLLNKIELYQVLNASEDGRAQVLWFFPFWQPEGIGWSELLISGEGTGEEAAEKKRKALLFLLQLPGIGKLRIEVRVWERHLYGRFQTADPEVDRLLTRHLPRLRDGLAALGYQADFESRVVSGEQLGNSLTARLERFPDFLVSLMV